MKPRPISHAIAALLMLGVQIAAFGLLLVWFGWFDLERMRFDNAQVELAFGVGIAATLLYIAGWGVMCVVDMLQGRPPRKLLR